MSQPRFITLEGGEGAGKSTQARALRGRLEALGHEVILTREPGGAPGAEAIRHLLVTGDTGRWSPLAETLLHFAAREDHLTHTIRPALARGAWVVSDRFVDSTFAYQGGAQGVGEEAVRQLSKLVVGEDMPALTIILDLPVDIGLARAHRRAGVDNSGEDRYERMEQAFHHTLREAFLAIARAQPERCVVIDASQSEEEVARQIWHSVTSRLAT
ncbi:dTMP kinase [Parvibaculum sp.]|uniref:dTMP kinase n=1 Tax=Parvibaculum sp. TaxID=2024848 RepID=UPI00320E23B9